MPSMLSKYFTCPYSFHSCFRKGDTLLVIGTNGCLTPYISSLKIKCTEFLYINTNIFINKSVFQDLLTSLYFVIFFETMNECILYILQAGFYTRWSYSQKIIVH